MHATSLRSSISVRPQLSGSRTILAGVLVGLILAGGYLAYTGGASADSQIDSTIIGAISTLQRATIAKPGTAATEVTSSDMQSQSAALPSVLGQYFTGAPLTRYASTLQTTMGDQVAGGLRDVDGGASQVTITSLTVSGDTASATARANIWISTVSLADGTTSTTPHQWWDYTLQLIQTQAGWRVDEISFHPEPGNGP